MVVIFLAFLRTLHTDFCRGCPGLLSPTVNTSSSFLTSSPVFAFLYESHRNGISMRLDAPSTYPVQHTCLPRKTKLKKKKKTTCEEVLGPRVELSPCTAKLLLAKLPSKYLWLYPYISAVSIPNQGSLSAINSDECSDPWLVTVLTVSNSRTLCPTQNIYQWEGYSWVGWNNRCVQEIRKGCVCSHQNILHTCIRLSKNKLNKRYT